MSDQDQTPDQEQGPRRFRNEETVLRRAWIDRALAGVRSHLEGADPLAPAPAAPPAEPGPTGLAAGPPRLYVVPGGRTR